MTDRPDSDREVLTSLPRSRPVRRSAKRGAPSATANAAQARSASPKSATAQKPAATPGRKASAAKPRAAAASTKPRAAAGSTKTQAKPAATAAIKAGAGDRVRASRAATAGRTRTAAPRATEPKRVVPPRKVPPAGYAAATARGERDEHDSNATKLLSTAVQAANELTQIGLTVGRQALQSMLDRLPKP